VVEASGAVHGATQIVYSAASGVNPSALFAGGGVTITQAIVMPLSAYAPSTLVDLGMRTNGVAVFSGPVTLTRINTAPIFNFTAPLNALARFTAPVTGFFVMRKTGVGTVAFENVNSWTNDSDISAGTLWAVDGVGLPSASRLQFTGGVLESTGVFNRVLGLGPGQVAWRTAAAHGGFSAQGGKLTVDLNNDGPNPLTWGSFGFVSNNTQLRFNSPLADNTVEFVDPLVINAGVTFHAYDNPAVRSDKAVLSGVLSGSGGFAKNGPGTLVLAATNTLAGNLAVNADGGTLLVNGELPSNVSTLTVYSNGFLGGSGTIRTRTVTMLPGSGFDWADDPGTLTITNSFAFPSNGVFRFVSTEAGASKVVSGSRLTLPPSATVDVQILDGFPPPSAVILSSTNTVGSVDGWTIANNSWYNYALVKTGHDVILQRRSKGTVITLY
jgi:autotransporter-associated beta strand protein